jgi:hypothetical protein
VAAGAEHGDEQAVGRGELRARAAGEHAPVVLRRDDVQRVRRLRRPARGLEHALGDHVAGPVEPLLARLEHEHHVAGEFAAPRAEQPGRADQAGGVEVVPARVHRTRVRRGELLAAALRDGQRVHVTAEQHDRAGSDAA